jgi:hypothetical protein
MVGGVARVIRLSVVCASKDTVGTVLVQDIGVKENTDAGRNTRGCVTLVVGTLCIAGGGADAGVIGLSLGEGLDAHVGVGAGWGDDRSVSKRNWAGEAWKWLRRGGVGVGTSDDDVEGRLILSNVVCQGGRDRSPEESALDAGDRAGVGTSGIIGIFRGITFKIFGKSAEHILIQGRGTYRC